MDNRALACGSSCAPLFREICRDVLDAHVGSRVFDMLDRERYAVGYSKAPSDSFRALPAQSSMMWSGSEAHQAYDPHASSEMLFRNG